MEFDFDKEIDVLLRRAARGGEAPASADSRFETRDFKSPHLDADEISAFAENAVPEKIKPLYVAHFADCARCRKILANVAALNSDAQAAPILQNDEVKIAAPTPVSWYKKLFAAPTLAYAMGALLLVFGGLIAVTFLKNSPRNSAEVSQAVEKPLNGRGASSDGETVTTESSGGAPSSASMSNASMMNSNSAQTNSTATRGVPAPNDSAMSNGTMSAANNSSAAAQKESAKNQTPNKSPEKPVNANENQTSGSNFAGREQPRAAAEEEKRSRENGDKSSDNTAAANVAAKPAPPLKQDAPQQSPPAPSAALSRAANALPDGAKAKNAPRAAPEKAETRFFGGKNFRRAGGVWYDAAYGGQSTQSVARGSSEFKNLDAGLRSIAENFSGAVVVVWKDKAYRIQ